MIFDLYVPFETRVELLKLKALSTAIDWALNGHPDNREEDDRPMTKEEYLDNEADVAWKERDK